MEFDPSAEWLSLDTMRYPEFSLCPATVFSPYKSRFIAAEFYRRVSIPAGKSPVAHICVFADTKFRLSVNGSVVGVGPVAAGGDYGNEHPMPKQYYNRYEVGLSEISAEPDGTRCLELFAEVQTPGEVQTDYSCCKGGFILSCEITYSDREPFLVVSDEKWLARKNTRALRVEEADLTIPLPEWEKPEIIPKEDAPWKLTFADIPMPVEETILPVSVSETEENGRKLVHAEFKRIYSAYLVAEVDNPSDKPVDIELFAVEYSPNVKNVPTARLRVGPGKSSLRQFRMRSIGEALASFDIDTGVSVSLRLIYVHYPIDHGNEGYFECSDEKLNGIWALGRDALEMCRQTLHLDSPLHQETLGCLGDYAIETMMTHTTFGDMRLARLDLIRISNYLIMNNGRAFHTTYSLLFMDMLLDYYNFTADIDTVKQLLPTVDLLLSRFWGYVEDGVIENPPDFMFVDWGMIDGYNMHHPPKALGQTSMNAFYQRAIKNAAALYALVGRRSDAGNLRCLSATHRHHCRERFYDEKLGVFKDGDSAPAARYRASKWLPENSTSTYHTRQANILAVWSGLVSGEDALAILDKVVNEESLDGKTFLDVQPYFMHYLLEAVRNHGRFSEYGLKLIHLWDKQLADSPKGMKEGWNEFRGDASHAWGATPTWQLPAAVSGFRMIDAGFRKFALKPELYGLEWARVGIPTPVGLIKISLKKDAEPEISVPDGISVLSVKDGEFLMSMNAVG